MESDVVRMPEPEPDRSGGALQLSRWTIHPGCWSTLAHVATVVVTLSHAAKLRVRKGIGASIDANVRSEAALHHRPWGGELI